MHTACVTLLNKKGYKMNELRRAEIRNIISVIESIPEKIQKVLEDEQEYNDNMPENLELSSHKEKSDYAIERLEDAQFYLVTDTTIDLLKDAIG